MALRVALLLLFVACSGSDGKTPTPDADLSLPLCTGATFDPCTDASQCTSGMCQEFAQLGITVCTQTCDVNNLCPMQNGMQPMCNNKGLCRPITANSCRR